MKAGAYRPRTREPIPDLDIETIDQARFWVSVMHRRTVADAEHIGELYERVRWLALPWWRRAGRRPPWLRTPPKFTVGRHLRP